MMWDFEKNIYYLIKGVFRLLGLIPRSWAIPLGNFLGHIIYFVDKKHRKITLDNLSHAFRDEKSPAEVRLLARQVFKNLGQILFEVAWSLRLTESDFDKHFLVKGMTHLINAYNKKKGVLVLTAHMGNWELLTIIAALTGCPISIVVRPLDFKPLQKFFGAYRTRLGGELIPSKKAARMVMKGLKQNRVVAMLMDQNVDWYEGVFVDFFGRLACTNRGLATLALKTGAPVVSVFLARENGRYLVEFGPEIPLIQTGDKTADVERNTQQYNATIEAFVRRYPDQWFWVHQRWKTKTSHPWSADQ